MDADLGYWMMGRYEETKNQDATLADYASAARMAPTNAAIQFAYAGYLHNHGKI